MIHVIGLAQSNGTHQRLRCAWCGTSLADYSMQPGDMGIINALPPGAYIELSILLRDDNRPQWSDMQYRISTDYRQFIVAHQDDGTPVEACFDLDPSVTA